MHKSEASIFTPNLSKILSIEGYFDIKTLKNYRDFYTVFVVFFDIRIDLIFDQIIKFFGNIVSSICFH